MQPSSPFSNPFRSASRRQILKGLGATALAAGLPRAFAETPADVKLTIGTTPGVKIPADFTGLSYESAQLAYPDFFSGQSEALARFFRLLGTDGTLRLGGNLSEFTFWSEKRGPVVNPGTIIGPDPGGGTDRRWTVTPDGVDGLAAFLGLTGWKLIYGLNLAAGNVADETSEAAYVASRTGKALTALQFGNEPDLFKHYELPKKDRWTYDEFLARWNTMYESVRTRLPQVPIAGPDTSFQPKWTTRFAEEERAKICMLTGHFYADGPPSNPELTTDYLLAPSKRIGEHVLRSIDIARANGLRYRMAEGNTCYNAGKQGVSDTFASAIWVADLWLQLAAAGASGVNLHGGANGLYTPIAGSATTGFTARPIFYGMMLAGQFAGAQMLPVQAETGGKNVVAYAAQATDGLRVAVLNRTADPVTVRLAMPGHSARVLRLEAPALDSTTGVTFGGAEVNRNGEWKAKVNETLHPRNGHATLSLKPQSAALLKT